jgi:hypothetical protein
MNMNKYAISSLVISIFGFLFLNNQTIGFLGISGATAIVITLVLFYTIPIVSLVLGIVAVKQIKRTGERGKTIAIIAIVMSAMKLIGLILLVGFGALLATGGQ